MLGTTWPYTISQADAEDVVPNIEKIICLLALLLCCKNVQLMSYV